MPSRSPTAGEDGDRSAACGCAGPCSCCCRSWWCRLTVLALVPTYAIWAAFGTGLDAPLSAMHFVAGGAVTIAVSVAMWVFGRRLSHRLVHRRRQALDEYLADPTRG